MGLKKVLIISPHFPPSNAADMQRVRMSLPYYRQFGWEPVVVTVDQRYTGMVSDQLLALSLPPNLRICQVKALNKRITSKFGLGSIALRSLWYYWRAVNQMLRREQYDLVFFSTTAFPVCILGGYWKKRFGVPYIIDMQDPWHSDYYQDKPRDQRPPKYWFSYRLNKFLEPIAMKRVGGLIGVSQNYIDDLKQRYPATMAIPTQTITFGAYEPDIEIAEQHRAAFPALLDPSTINLLYVGRGGNDMQAAVSKLFAAFKKGLEIDPDTFSRISMYFIGTSYAPAGQGRRTIMPLAATFGIQGNVTEITDRISYFHTLSMLRQANALFIPGSDDPKYTASKIYPYLLVKKPLLAIFSPESSSIRILREYGVKHVFDFKSVTEGRLLGFLRAMAEGRLVTKDYDPEAEQKYSALTMTAKLCAIFDRVIHGED